MIFLVVTFQKLLEKPLFGTPFFLRLRKFSGFWNNFLGNLVDAMGIVESSSFSERTLILHLK